MTLDNLLGRSLDAVAADKQMIQRLLAAAVRNIADAQTVSLSNENRFDMAYKAIMQIANAALQANGYRTKTSVPGHHQTMIQSLSKTIGLERNIVVQLDALRKQRNIADYSGDLVTDSAMNACLVHAASLLEQVEAFLAEHYPELVQA
ncbi:MAG: DNA-binding protein [Gammaproteobacteria bacterium]|nr:DNA-binding protein [Gammaproteobacteria bacterium]